MVLESMHKRQSEKETVTSSKSKEGSEKGKKQCNSRESNPGLIRGRDLSYHLTTIALFVSLPYPTSSAASTNTPNYTIAYALSPSHT